MNVLVKEWRKMEAQEKLRLICRKAAENSTRWLKK